MWTEPSGKEETVPPRGGGIGLYLPKDVLSPLWILYHFGEGGVSLTVCLGVTRGLNSVQEGMGTNDPALGAGGPA